MTWRDPPILEQPGPRPQDANGRELMLFYDGSKLRRSPGARRARAYWVTNTIGRKISNARMLAIASSFAATELKLQRDSARPRSGWEPSMRFLVAALAAALIAARPRAPPPRPARAPIPARTPPSASSASARAASCASRRPPRVGPDGSIYVADQSRT